MSRYPLRVLMMTSTFPRWAGDTEPPFVYNLADRLTEKFQVTVLAPHAPGAKISEEWSQLNIRRFRYFWPARFERLAYGGILPNLKKNPLLWALVPFFIVAEFMAALRLVRSQQIDVLHAHWVIPQGIAAAMVSAITRTPVLTTCHAADIYGLRGPFLSGLKRRILNRSSYITGVSSSLMETLKLLKVSPTVPTAIISMGVDTQKFHPNKRDADLRQKLSGSDPFLLFVGRLAEKKGVKYLLDAMPQVIEQFPAAKLVIVGDGPLRGDLDAQCKRLSLGDRVKFLGAVQQDQLPALYASADIFVAPSIVTDGGDTEGLPTVLVEALASGCPAVATDVGGASEVVVPGQTGVLITERSAEEIAGGICRLLKDAALRESLRNAGSDWVRSRFDQQVVADKYADVVLQLGGATR